MGGAPVNQEALMHPDPNAPPVNPLPPIVWALATPIILLELAFSAGTRGFVGGPNAVGWRLSAIEDYGFFGPLFDRMLATGDMGGGALLRMFSYVFVNYSFTQTIFVIVFLLALGNMVGRIFSAPAVLVIFFGSAFAGAAVYGLVLDDMRPLVGGYPAVYGLIGAYTFLLWIKFGVEGSSQYQAFTLIAFLMGIQLIFTLLFGGTNDWVADIAGFVAGFALSFIVSPGGWSRVRARIKHR